jgi:hypothetical protein
LESFLELTESSMKIIPDFYTIDYDRKNVMVPGTRICAVAIENEAEMKAQPKKTIIKLTVFISVLAPRKQN